MRGEIFEKKVALRYLLKESYFKFSRMKHDKCSDYHNFDLNHQ